MLWIIAAAIAAEPVPVASFELGQTGSYWSLGDSTFSSGASYSTKVDNSDDRRAFGIAGHAAEPRVPRELVRHLVDGQTCRVVVSGEVVEVTGCVEEIAEVTRETVAKWKWQTEGPHEFELRYRLRDAWRFDDLGCFMPFVLWGSGTPVLSGASVAGCSVTPRGELSVPMPPPGGAFVQCTVSLVATAEGPRDMVVDGCGEPLAGIVAEGVATWRFRAPKGESTPYTLRISLNMPSPR